MINKIKPSIDENYLSKSLEMYYYFHNKFDLIKVFKVKKNETTRLGTSKIYSSMSPPSLQFITLLIITNFNGPIETQC